MRDLKVALRALRRDWSGGELGVLALALVVSVASVASVGFFTDRIHMFQNIFNTLPWIYKHLP